MGDAMNSAVLQKIRAKLFSKEKVLPRVRIEFSRVSEIEPFEAKLVKVRRPAAKRRLNGAPYRFYLTLHSSDESRAPLGVEFVLWCTGNQWHLCGQTPIRAYYKHPEDGLREVRLTIL